jgi:simple sugar transport system ATP-binding protein
MYGFFPNPSGSEARRSTQKLVDDFEIKVPSLGTPAKFLSGGNMQKMILARELSRDPRIVIAAQPTRGLDVGMTEYVRRRLLQMRDDGRGVLLVSADLDEILMLSDRVAIMFGGEILGFLDPGIHSIEEFGMLMAGERPLGSKVCPKCGLLARDEKCRRCGAPLSLDNLSNGE